MLRYRRKKCDEKSPVCSRCEKSNSECAWPRPTIQPLVSELETPQASRLGGLATTALTPGTGVDDTSDLDLVYSNGPYHSGSLFALRVTSPAVDTNMEDLNSPRGFHSGSTPSTGSDQTESSWITPTEHQNTHSVDHVSLIPTHPKHLGLKNWEYAQEFGPQVIWPPKDPEDDHYFDPEDVMPTIRNSIDFLTRTVVIEPVFQEMFHFYSTFLSRLFYDYAMMPDSIVGWMLHRFQISDSAKYGMLATAVLFRANYERSPMTSALRNHASELHTLACRQIELDLGDSRLPPRAKLSGLIEITNYEYYSSTLSRYYPHLLQTAPIVRQISGSDTLDLLSLSGKHTFDLRCFAWCDILNSMATSQPTRLKYVSDIERGQPFNLEDAHANPDRGVEWIYGCPDVLAVLLARTSALRHSQAVKDEKLRDGAKLEQQILNWEFRPTHAKGSVMRVARVGVQEIWRHTAILYVHQSIFRSDPVHPTVRNSVKNIVRIASTLKPGVNPDCFLSAPYFIAGTFAISQKDRHFLRSRILSSGNEYFLRDLASSLGDLWVESDATGRFTTWSDKEPQTIIF
ncbi:unnamed protein product [Rhizoctonia solani]|uniref:Zn(2)-C6 fungal-type domain-containing protein n=1 Tax=Rhizoctonia solani TaxID=456999 RepID=A0A8H3AS83_9AGAM|nr:unnamed protein product [Rhizoctonia solani]